MPSTYTVSGRFTLQATGENFNTWGGILNAQTIALIDSALSGVAAFTLSGAKTLTTANGLPDEARMAVLNITGGTGGTVTIPAVSKLYVVRNATVGAVVISCGTANTATVQAGETAQVATDGASVWRVRSTMFDGATLQGLGPPAQNTDAATKLYVDQAISGVAAGGLPPAVGKQGQFIGNDGSVPLWTDTSTLTWTLGGVRLGGKTNAFPMLKQSGTTIAARLADDSGDAALTAASPAPFDSSTAVPNTQFLQSRLGNFSATYAINASSSLLPADAGKAILFYSSTPITATLPTTAAVATGSSYYLSNQNMGTVTVARSGSDNIMLGNAAVTSFTIPGGDWAFVTVNPGGGWAVYGSASLAQSTIMQSPGFVTAPKFDISTRLATDAFVQNALGSYSSIGSSNISITLDPSQIGQELNYWGSGAATWTLPLLSAIPNSGAAFLINNQGPLSLALKAQGADTLAMGTATGAASVWIPSGSFATVVAEKNGNSGQWRVCGTATLQYDAQFAFSNAANGYQKFPSGQIWQWGSATAAATPGNGAPITFPVTYPIGFKSGTISGLNAAGQSIAWIYASNPSGLSFAANVGSLICGWMAAGF